MAKQNKMLKKYLPIHSQLIAVVAFILFSICFVFQKESFSSITMSLFGNFGHTQGLPHNFPQHHVRRHANLEYTHYDLGLEITLTGQPASPRHHNVHTWGPCVNHPYNWDHITNCDYAIWMTECALDVDVPRQAIGSTTVSSNLSGCANSMRCGIIVRTVLGLYYGFDQVYTSQNASLDIISRSLENRILHAINADQLQEAVDERAYYRTYVLPLIDFLLKWRIHPNYGIIVNDIFKCNMISFRRLVTRRSGRAGCPLWSRGKLISHGLGQRDSPICNGHMLEFAILLDRVIVNFDSVVPHETSHVLPTENVPAMFQFTRRYRLYWAL